MIDANQVEYPAECYISFQKDDVTTPCTVHLSSRGNNAYVLFSHDAGVMGFSGPMNADNTITVNVVGAGSEAVRSRGLCRLEETGDVACTGAIGRERLTIAAKARMQF